MCRFFFAWRGVYFSGGVFSWFYGPIVDVLLLTVSFLPELWRLPGHFRSAEAFYPEIVALYGTFSFGGGVFSRFCGAIVDVLLLPVSFLLELWRLPGHFLSVVDFFSRKNSLNEDVLFLQFVEHGTPASIVLWRG